MKKNYIICLIIILPCLVYSQIEYRLLSDSGSSIRDINSLGIGILGNALYDFENNIITPENSGNELTSINDNGEMSGIAPYYDTNGDLYEEPAYKINNVWGTTGFFTNHPPEIGSFASASELSENGKYMTGILSTGPSTGSAYRYNTETSTLEEVIANQYETTNGYSINNTGVIGGWSDIAGGSTVRLPSIMELDNSILEIITNADRNINAINKINDNGITVGDFNGKAFYYNHNSQEYIEFNATPPYTSATFTSVSENGVAVGYYQEFNPSIIIREAIIYHPSLGSQPIFLKNYLDTQNITTETIDDRLGTAISISNNGQYICGWENSAYFIAKGWVIKFDDSLSISEHDISDFISVYPNPVSDIAFIDISNIEAENITINIFSSLGQKIQTRTHWNTSEKIEINFSKMKVSSGIYYVSIETEIGRAIKKIIKQ